MRTEPVTVRQALGAARRRLDGLPEADPGLDAEVLLAQVLGHDRSWLYAWPDHALSAAQWQRFEALLERRAAGVPVAHLSGRREFWSLDLEVSPDTLIPRPDTELLVEWALACLPPQAPARVLDLGTGSGAIALALAHERPAWRITGVDRSAAALAVARRNARRLGLDRVRFLAGDWFAPLDPQVRFDLIVGNPPYVASDDPHLQRGDVRHEPRSALAAGPTGLDELRRIAATAPAHLAPGGWLLLEHGPEQGAAVRDLLVAAGLAEVSTRRDLGGRERATGGRQGQGPRAKGQGPRAKGQGPRAKGQGPSKCWSGYFPVKWRRDAFSSALLRRRDSKPLPQGPHLACRTR